LATFAGSDFEKSGDHDTVTVIICPGLIVDPLGPVSVAIVTDGSSLAVKYP
jgi:hypothetical protein